MKIHEESVNIEWVDSDGEISRALYKADFLITRHFFITVDEERILDNVNCLDLTMLLGDKAVGFSVMCNVIGGGWSVLTVHQGMSFGQFLVNACVSDADINGIDNFNDVKPYLTLARDSAKIGALKNLTVFEVKTKGKKERL